MSSINMLKKLMRNRNELKQSMEQLQGVPSKPILKDNDYKPTEENEDPVLGVPVQILSPLVINSEVPKDGIAIDPTSFYQPSEVENNHKRNPINDYECALQSES